MNRNDYENILYENREDAKAEGHRKGRKEGYIEGLKDGHKEGHKEGHLFMAKKMLENGIDAELVCRISGLTLEEIMEAAS